MILAIETSCDETAAALVTADGEVRSSVVASQADLHARYGGVVPEVASRRHLELVVPVIREALDAAGAGLADVERVAVTQGPGLVGALLVGISAAKAIAWARRLPLVPVDHLDGHVASLALAPAPLEPPFLACSRAAATPCCWRSTRTAPRGGSASTLDDAAGEAFDKGARLLGLGYPGGAAIDRLAREGDRGGVRVSRGARSRARLLVLGSQDRAPVRGARPRRRGRGRRADLAASYQRAIVRALSGRARQAAEETGLERLAVVGGVAANSGLRAALPEATFAPLSLCTDNAAMIALSRALRDARSRTPSTLPWMRIPRSAGRLAVAPSSWPSPPAVAAAQERTAPPSGAEGWQGLLGSRPVPQLGGRWIVVLRARSLADRVARAGGVAGEAQMKSWTATARIAQKRMLARLAFKGAPVQPEHEYVRVAERLRRLDRHRSALGDRARPGCRRRLPGAGRLPAATDTTAPRRSIGPAAAAESTSASQASTARASRSRSLDTGVDFDHPFIGDALLPGIDIVDPGGLAEPGESPTEAGRLERHGTELAGLVVGSDGPAGLHGVAPKAFLRPIRVAGWQPDATGGVSIYSRTDQVLAGLEAAVDPNHDGDAHDAARIALVGLVEPFVSFADAPLARAAAGALALDTLVVAPAGNDGPAGSELRERGRSGGRRRRRSPSPPPTRVGAARPRTSSSAPGCACCSSGEQPLGGAVVARGTATAPSSRSGHGGRRGRGAGRLPAAVRRERRQPGGRHRAAASAGAADARSGAGARRRGRAGRARRRAAPGRRARDRGAARSARARPPPAVAPRCVPLAAGRPVELASAPQRSTRTRASRRRRRSRPKG